MGKVAGDSVDGVTHVHLAESKILGAGQDWSIHFVVRSERTKISKAFSCVGCGRFTPLSHSVRRPIIDESNDHNDDDENHCG